MNKLELLIITDCPVCHESTGQTFTIRNITKYVKHTCIECGSLINIPLSDDNEIRIIRKGCKK